MVNTYLDRRVEPARRLSRFLVFGIVAVIALSGLTARLFYLQVVNGSEYSVLAQQNRTALEPVTAPRGLIFDRDGRPLVTNAAMYSVKVRAADTDYRFFVVKPGTCGEHSFTASEAEFEQLAAEYQQALQAEGGSPTECG